MELRENVLDFGGKCGMGHAVAGNTQVVRRRTRSVEGVVYHGGVLNEAIGVIERECPDCGASYATRPDKPKPRCFDCAVGRFAENVQQARNKSGPMWERTVRGQLKYWRAEAKRLGLRRA